MQINIRLNFRISKVEIFIYIFLQGLKIFRMFINSTAVTGKRHFFVNKNFQSKVKV